jgi:hypothetical protein
MGPVAVMVRLPVTASAPSGVNVKRSDCTPLVEKTGVPTLNGEDAPPTRVARRVTCAGAFPVFVTLKGWLADARSWIEPKLPKFGVAEVSKARIAPLGSSVRVMLWGEAPGGSASVSIASVAAMGVTGALRGTPGATIPTLSCPPAGIVSPTVAVVLNPEAPVTVTAVTCASIALGFVSKKSCVAGAAPPQATGPKSIDEGQPAT